MSRISAETGRLVRRRAMARCEYCHFPEAHAALPFQIDHIIARQHRGESVPANLALACLFCNSAKGPNIAGVDPVSGAIVPLFHPRRDQWAGHFVWKSAWLGGKTPRGRATIEVLQINEPAAVAVRASLLEEGVLLD